MKINASSRLLAANLPPELLAIPKNSSFRRDLASSLIRVGIDLNTAKFERLSNEDALRALRGSKGFGVLFCFDIDKFRPNKIDCAVIGTVETSPRRYSTRSIISTHYRDQYSPITVAKECDVVYFVKGNKAEYDRLTKQLNERRENFFFERKDPARENQERYQQQLAERHLQKAAVNAAEFIRLVKNAAVNAIQNYDFTEASGLTLSGEGLRSLNSYILRLYNTHGITLYKIAKVAKGEVSTKNDAELINFLATLDLNKVRSDLSRF